MGMFDYVLEQGIIPMSLSLRNVTGGARATLILQAVIACECTATRDFKMMFYDGYDVRSASRDGRRHPSLYLGGGELLVKFHMHDRGTLTNNFESLSPSTSTQCKGSHATFSPGLTISKCTSVIWG